MATQLDIQLTPRPLSRSAITAPAVRPCAECAVAANAGVIMNWARFALNTGCFRYPSKNHWRLFDGTIGHMPGPHPGRRQSF
eukprot:9498660-Pyramimonas_sp.AAC.1